ncbi:MAG: transaldolase family protein [Oscillospiraceae bacterium]|nr:transaldolase family protein [Oscillospiraceae bacterium]
MTYKSPMHEMSQTTPTQFWNDNCSLTDLAFSIEHGAVGATTNPVIVGQVLEAEMAKYKPEIEKLIARNPTATEDDIGWLLNEKMACDGAKLLKPIFEQTGGKAGFISIQTNTKYFRDTDKMVEQAVRFSKLAKNMMVKMPMTAQGVKAVEECTYHGININATVSFTVSQAIAVAEAVERGMARRAGEGKDNAHLFPVCTIMVGRVEDWLREVGDSKGITVDPNAYTMSGVAVFKNAYKIYKERGYHTRLLAAAYRHHHHWSEFIGGDISMTIPPMWVRRFAASDIAVKNRMDTPVDPKLIAQLQKHFPDFDRAYQPDGIEPEEFEFYGATNRTLKQFLSGYDKMISLVRGVMVAQ